MRLYVLCPNTNQRIYLSFVVEKRSQIEQDFQVICSYDNQTHYYRPEDVEAEPSYGAAIGGTVIGGVVGGIAAGPIGAIIGGIFGIIAGSSAEEEERRRVRQFYEG